MKPRARFTASLGYSLLIGAFVSAVFGVPLSAQASPERCLDLFSNEPWRLAHSIDIVNTIAPLRGYSSYLEKRWMRFLLRRSGVELSPVRLHAMNDYDRAVWAFLRRTRKIEVLSDPTFLLDSFANRKDLSVANWVERQVLVHGLRAFVEQNVPLSPHHVKQRTKIILSILKVIKSPYFSLAMMMPPHLKDRPIPTELLAKIVADGIHPHRNELQNHYQAQKYVDAYRKFAAVYRVALTVIGFWLVIDQWNAQEHIVQDQNNAKIDELTKSLDRLSELLSQGQEPIQGASD